MNRYQGGYSDSRVDRLIGYALDRSFLRESSTALNLMSTKTVRFVCIEEITRRWWKR